MEILTFNEFNDITKGAVIAFGVLPNSPEGLYMINSRIGAFLLWVAIKGYNNDWAIYCHWEEKEIDFVKTQGDKLTNNEDIKKCVPCTDEVYDLYRR